MAEASAEAVVEAEASMEAEALVEVHLENSTTNRSATIQISPIQMDHLQQFTLISRAILLTAIIHLLPEEIGMEIVTEMRQSTVLQQLMPS